MSNPLPRALPWASAAGVAVLLAGVVAGQLEGDAAESPTASMASAAAPAAPERAAAPEVVADTPAAAKADRTTKPGDRAAATAGSAAAAAEPDVTVVPAAVARALDTGREHLGTLRKAPAVTARTFSFLAAGYSTTLSSAALVPVRSAASPAGVGYSAVTLTKRAGTSAGACDIVGAGYWLSDPVEKTYPNPTASRAHKSAAGTTDIPAIYTGPGVRWDAACASDASGRAVANTVEVAQAEGMGSTVSASVDKRTGAYVGTARSYVLGMRTSAGVLDSVTSLVQVRVASGGRPVVTYKVSIVDGGRAFALAGKDVAAADLPAQFAEQMDAEAGTLKAVAGRGVQVVLPPGGAHELTGPVVVAGGAAVGEARFTGRFR